MIDLRSDTVTLPSKEMREGIARAEVGDDVYGEDPTVKRLEEVSAHLLGKEAALFMPSGTMGNLTAVLTHCDRGSEMILGEKSHIFLNELGGAAALGGVQPLTIPNQPDGSLDPEHIQGAIRSEDIHHPRTKLICLENTQNMCGGAVLGPDYTNNVGKIARENGLRLHLDGARIFNASTALDLDPAVLVESVDSVMFCLSKGLGAPIGSVLCGSSNFISDARRTRKMLGGGMRQVGLVAAAGLYALEHNLPLLIEDHRRAKVLSAGLNELNGLELLVEDPASNMVYLELNKGLDWDAASLKAALKERGVLVGIEGDRHLRLVTHFWIQDPEIDRVIEAFKDVLQ